MSIPNVKMDIGSMSDNEIAELFENAFASIADRNNIEDPEIECQRSSSRGPVKIKVNIYGMAGAPTADTYSQGIGIQQVTIGRVDKGKLLFRYVPSLTSNLGGNEYQVIYESI